jgi:hypothetical protein
MSKSVQQRVIEIITTQAISQVAAGRYVDWERLNGRGSHIDEKWFWDNFTSVVKTTEDQLSGAVEGWVTVEFEGRVIERINAMRRMFKNELEREPD